MTTNAAGQGPVAPLWSDTEIYKCMKKHMTEQELSVSANAASAMIDMRKAWATDRAALKAALEQHDSQWRDMFLEMRDMAVAAEKKLVEPVAIPAEVREAINVLLQVCHRIDIQAAFINETLAVELWLSSLGGEVASE